MSAGRAIARNLIFDVAADLRASLSHACEQIEIAGSVRRNSPLVHDIELVAIPRFGWARMPGELVDTYENLLEVEIREQIDFGKLQRHPEDPKDGKKYKKLWLPDPGITIDLYCVLPPAQWGPALAIRTGPADFSRMLVSRMRTFGVRCENLEIIRMSDGQCIPCPTEARFFELCGTPWLPPERRGA